MRPTKDRGLIHPSQTNTGYLPNTAPRARDKPKLQRSSRRLRPVLVIKIKAEKDEPGADQTTTTMLSHRMPEATTMAHSTTTNASTRPIPTTVHTRTGEQNVSYVKVAEKAIS